MNVTLRRLVAGGLSTLTVFWATRPTVALAVSDIQQTVPRATASAAQNELKLATGQTRSFKANCEIHWVEVADPEVAEVMTADRELSVLGLKEGSTKVTIWYATSDKPAHLTVQVLRETEPVLSDPQFTQTGLATPDSRIGTVFGSEVPADTNYVQQVPAISIESSGPVMATVGKVVEQQIVVKNVGSVTAEQVEVRGNVSIDSQLVGTEPKAELMNSTLVWRLGAIPAGGQQKIIVRVKPLVAGELSCQTNVSFKSSASVKVQVREPKLKLTCTGPSTVVVGSQVHISLTVTNEGTAPAEAIRIRQIVPGVTPAEARVSSVPLQIMVGTLQPGEARTLDTSSTAREPGVVKLNLIAETEDGFHTSVEHQLRVTAPKLALNLAGPDFRYLNRKATYQVAVANPGDATATNVNLIVGLPNGLEYVEGNAGASYDPTKRTITWLIGNLEARQKREFSVTLLPKAEGQHLQRAVAWADNNLLAKADMVTRVDGLTSLAMEVVDVEDPIEVGAETTYQIHISNRGSKTAERIQVAATLPDGMTAAGVDGHVTYRVKGQQLVFEPIASLAPQSATVLQVRVRGTRKGTQRFRAVMTSPDMSTAVITEEATEVYGE